MSTGKEMEAEKASASPWSSWECAYCRAQSIDDDPGQCPRCGLGLWLRAAKVQDHHPELFVLEEYDHRKRRIHISRMLVHRGDEKQ